MDAGLAHCGSLILPETMIPQDKARFTERVWEEQTRLTTAGFG